MSGFIPPSSGARPRDYFVEVAKGNVAGESLKGIVMTNDGLVAGSFFDLWGGGATNIVWPTAAETWEIVSDNANDSSGGSGARQVSVSYLDDQYIEQTEVVTLNGLTPVVLLGGDHFRPNGAQVISSGSSRENEGEIVIRVSGGGNPRQYIKPGFSVSQDGHFTVPANKTAFALQSTPFYEKNQDGDVRGRLLVFGTNTFLTTGQFAFYQNAFDIEVKALVPFPEKSDLIFQGTSTNPGPITVSLVLELLIVDNL